MSNPWTKKEEEVLVKQRKEGKTLEEIKNNYFPDRTLDSIIHKAKRLIPLQERRKILKKAQNKPIPKLSKEAMDTYADYEQLTGGVETLFKWTICGHHRGVGAPEAVDALAPVTDNRSFNPFIFTL